MAKAAPEGTTKAMVVEQLSQAILSTSNLLQLIQEESPAQGLVKIPKNLLAKTQVVKNTEQVLEQLPQVISLLDENLDKALECASELHTIRSLLKNKDIASTSLNKTEGKDFSTHGGRERQRQG